MSKILGKINLKNISRQQAGNLFIIVGIIIITTLEWHLYDWYQTFTRYGTLITFAALAGAFFCYVDIKDALKDKLFWLMGIVDVIALANLFIIGSNKGCILVVVDFMLILYLSDKIAFSRTESLFTLIYTAFFFIYWTIDVKGYFKGYNTNYGGLILITGFAALMIILQVLNVKILAEMKSLKSGNDDSLTTLDNDSTYKITLARNIVYALLYAVIIALAFVIISWYRSRTALMGLVALLAIMIIPNVIISNKVVYTIITVLATAGSIAFSGLYILLGKMGDGEIQLFYKSVISGRNDIWSELWDAYLQQPITGIGSSYEMKLDYMAGVFEAHSAMMDILVVHGLIVFIPLCTLLIVKILKLRNQTAASSIGKVIFAAIICILVTGFFENFYIVQPFSLILLTLFAIKPETL